MLKTLKTLKITRTGVLPEDSDLIPRTHRGAHNLLSVTPVLGDLKLSSGPTVKEVHINGTHRVLTFYFEKLLIRVKIVTSGEK